MSRTKPVDAECVVIVFAVKPHRQADSEQVAEVARLLSKYFGFMPHAIAIPAASFPITDSGKIGRPQLKAMVDGGWFAASLQH